MRNLLKAATVALAAMALVPAAALADGQLDPGFGSGGRVVLSHEVSPGGDGTSSLLPLGAGRFLAAGIGDGNGVWVTQQQADGSLDPGFGEGGQAFHQLEFNSFTSASRAIREPDGAIVEVGGFEANGSSEFDSFIVRLTPQGQLDPSFGDDAPNPAGDGIDVYDFGGEDYAYDLVLDSTGRAVVVGRAGPGNDYEVHLARLEADGSIDPSFGGPEGVYTDLGGSEVGLAIAMQGDRLVVLASGPAGSNVLRYLPDGQLDPGFGDGGVAKAPLPAPLESANLMIEPSGDIVAAGRSGEHVQIARLQPGGAPDPGFGDGGVAVFSANPGDRFYVNGLARMDDGRILAAGGIEIRGERTEERPAVIRTLPNGKPDPSWGNGGVLEIPSPAGVFEGVGPMLVEPDRRIVLGGSEYNEAEEDSNRVLFKLLGDTTPPDTAITKAPPASGQVPLARAEFDFAPVGDSNTSFECALSQTPLATPKKKHKKHHHKKKRRHGKKAKGKAHGSQATTPTAGAAFTPCVSPVAYPAFTTPGDYRFAVRAIDPAGNVDPTPAEASVHLVAKQKHQKHKKKHHRRKHHKRHHRR